jgi:hypothetical protein
MINVKNFGKNLQLKEKGKKKPNPNTKKVFVDIVKSLMDLNNRSLDLEDNYGINLQNYEDPFYNTIESLLYLVYDDVKADLIMWYVYSQDDLEEEKPLLIVQNEETGEEEEVEIKSPEELYDFIKKLFKK